MSSTFGWNTTQYDSQPPNVPQYPPPPTNTNSSYPPRHVSATGQSYSPQSPLYYNPPQAPPPYHIAQSTFYSNGSQPGNLNSDPQRSPPPAYTEPVNNNYPNLQQYQNNHNTYNSLSYPPPPPVGTSQYAQHPPISHHNGNRSRNDNNNTSNRKNSLNGGSRTQTSEINNNTTGVYPQLPNAPVSEAFSGTSSRAAVGSRTQRQISHYKAKSDTPLPPNAILLWEGSRPIRIFFVQKEGHVVSPDKDIRFMVYKCPPQRDNSFYRPGSLAGQAKNASILMKAENVWRLGLSKERSYIVRGINGEYAFYDDSTSPARCVIIVFKTGLRKEEKQRLDVLLAGSSLISNEPTNVVDRFENGFGSAFESITDSFDNMVKKQTPELHKSSRWIRKTTGQCVRFSGNLVSKGVHLVSDNVMNKEKPKEALPNHQEVFAALNAYRTAVEKKKVSRATSYQ